jgi:hypothetical protein
MALALEEAGVDASQISSPAKGQTCSSAVAETLESQVRTGLDIRHGPRPNHTASLEASVFPIPEGREDLTYIIWIGNVKVFKTHSTILGAR